MKTKAAVLVETGKSLVLTEIEIPELREGQVLVEIVYSGICHTTLHEVRGNRGKDPYVPHCLGHEGTGIVKEIGSGVTKVKQGDKVILSWMKGSGLNVPGTKYSWDGKEVNAGGITTLQKYSVISENRLTLLPENLDMKTSALLGCAIPTGLGAIFNTAKAKKDDSLAVFGVGGIGLCSLAGAKIAECNPIIAIDINDYKLDLAKKMGATHTINAKSQDVLEEINKIGTLDIAIEASGVPEVMVDSLKSVRSQGGKTVIIGNAPAGQTVILSPNEFNQGKSMLGTWGGDNEPDRDFPKYCKLLASGKLKVDFLLSKTYKLEDVNQAFDDLEAGKVGRPIIDMS